MYAEMGAMYNQDKVSKRLFGIRHLPGTNYLRAMLAKMNGADYPKVVQVFYENAIKIPSRLHELGMLSAQELKKLKASSLKLAIKSSKRLFRYAANLKESGGISSKDLVYLEQFTAMQRLQKTNLEKLAFVSGINIEALRVLLKWSLIDLDSIKTPTDGSDKVWELIKDQFKLEN